MVVLFSKFFNTLLAGPPLAVDTVSEQSASQPRDPPPEVISGGPRQKRKSSRSPGVYAMYRYAMYGNVVCRQTCKTLDISNYCDSECAAGCDSAGIV